MSTAGTLPEAQPFHGNRGTGVSGGVAASGSTGTESSGETESEQERG